MTATFCTRTSGTMGPWGGADFVRAVSAMTPKHDIGSLQGNAVADCREMHGKPKE